MSREINISTRLTLLEVQSLAELKGGKLLSPIYKNTKTKMRFKCSKGHKFESTMGQIKYQNNWCPKCSREHLKETPRAIKKFYRLSIEEIKKLAEDKEGKCLSEVYQNNEIPLFFICKKKHEFTMKAKKLRQGHWCIKCHHEEIKEGAGECQTK